MATFFSGKKKLSKAAPQPQPRPLSKKAPSATPALRSVEMPAQPLPAVVPKQPQSNLEKALTRQQYAPAQPQPAVAPARPQATAQPYGPTLAEIQKQALIQQQQAIAKPQFTPQQLAELQKQNPSGFSQIQPAPANSPSKPATSVSKQSPNLSPYNASKQPTMSQADQFLETQAQMARANASKQPAMRKGGVVKKKPVAAAKKTTYAKGGMVMSNCGASMKPQQKRKK